MARTSLDLPPGAVGRMTGWLVDHFSYAPVFYLAGAIPLLGFALSHYIMGVIEPIDRAPNVRLGFWPTVYGNWIASSVPQENYASFEHVKEQTLLAEGIGFETLLLAEHFINPQSADWNQVDCWTTAAALAAVTEKIEIIAAVKAGFRAPGVIAKMASNIDHISNGRFAINLVSAWWLPEYEKLGAEILGHDERYARSEDYIQIIKGVWTEDDFTFSGKFYSVKEATIAPKPIQKPHPPVYIGGTSEPGERLGARFADIFLMNGRPAEQVGEIIESVKAFAAESGRPKPPRFGTIAFVVCRDTEEQVEREVERLAAMRSIGAIKGGDSTMKWEEHRLDKAELGRRLGSNNGSLCGLAGTPQHIAERIQAFEDAGLDTLLLQFHHPVDEMKRFADEVMPLLKR